MVKSEWDCISQGKYSWWYYSHSVMPHAWLPMLDGNALAVSRTRDGAGRKVSKNRAPGTSCFTQWGTTE